MQSLDPKRSFIKVNLYGHSILLAENYVGSAIIIPTTDDLNIVCFVYGPNRLKRKEMLLRHLEANIVLHNCCRSHW